MSGETVTVGVEARRVYTELPLCLYIISRET